jgi:subfamily B ATP-binding cassette protein MsbA
MLLAATALLISVAFSLAFPLLIARLLDSVTYSDGGRGLNRLALLLAGIFVGQAAFSFAQSYLLSTVGERVIYELRTQLYAQIHSLSLDFFGARRIGELVSRLTNDVTQMRNILTSSLALSLTHVVSLAGAVALMFMVNLRLTLFTFAILPAVVLVATVFGRHIQKASVRVQDSLARSTTVAEESLQGIRTVKSFGREQHEIRRFAKATRATLDTSIRQALYNSSFGALMMLLCFGSIGGIMWYGGHEVVAGRLSLPMITGFLIYGIMIASNLASLAGLFGQMHSAAGGIHRVFQILDLSPSVKDSTNAITLPTVRGSITFDAVSFGYDKATPVLHGITLNIYAGETLALVGPSGGGKSTVFNLIPRFYDPSIGGIYIDGFDLREVTQRSLRAQLAIVPQETLLFGGTIRENILYGRLDADDSEVISAAKAANAHGFIMQTPKQYETVVGERGATLSGGQRQRIAIAQAVLKNPRILLLDEATSSLDSDSEELVQEALNRLMHDRTTIIIAHRLSTIKTAHRIAVLDSGRITELGSHEELMKSRGLYSRLYIMQFRDSAENRLFAHDRRRDELLHPSAPMERLPATSTGQDWTAKLIPAYPIVTK